MSDEIRRWSEELAREPASMVFVPLGDALRRRGNSSPPSKWRRAASNGTRTTRMPTISSARIHADRGDMERAMDEWGAALRVAPHHAGALKGMGFACFQNGRASEAERYLVAAVGADPGDPTINAALSRLRAPQTGTNGASTEASASSHAPNDAPTASASQFTGGTADARDVFSDLLGDGEQTALLLDAHGYVLAGAYVVADGRDVAQDVGGALSGVSDEAHRAMRHLGLGEWSSIVFETEVASVAMAPVAQDEEIAIALVAAARTVPLGLVRRLLRRVTERSSSWLAGGAGQAGAGR